GFGLPCVLIAAATAVQRETPDAVLGRTAATAGSLMTAPNAVALALGAGLVAVADVRVLAVAAGTSAVLAAGVLAAGGRGLRGRT
ncbi:MFS transporter, partial [Streptomyces sp. SID10692]|nr:MFS transporter [Streptomyces sp. SID10692]